MIDAISKLVESGAISEDVQKSIQEAWDSKIKENKEVVGAELRDCLLYTSPSPRDVEESRMPSSA